MSGTTSTKPVLSSEAVEALAARIATAVVVGLAESGLVGITQRPKAEAPARRRSVTPKAKGTTKTATTSSTRSAKPNTEALTYEVTVASRSNPRLAADEDLANVYAVLGYRRGIAKPATFGGLCDAVLVYNQNHADRRIKVQALVNGKPLSRVESQRLRRMG